MYAAQATIRDYNAAADTCSVELTGMGVIDTWLDGVKIATPLDRSLVVSGAPATVTFPDATRLCEGIVVSIDGGLASPTTTTAGTVTKFQTLRADIGTDGAGHGSVAVLWPVPFSAVPANIFATPDNHHGTIAISAITASGFTATLSGGDISTIQRFTASGTGPA